MFRKYEKIYRIEMPDYQIKGKYHLAKAVEKKLFDGDCEITEKIDGGNCAVVKCNCEYFLQKKGSEADYSHPQYTFFRDIWFHTNKHKLDLLPDNVVVYFELMRCVHTVKYDKLPDWLIIIDVYDLKNERYLSWIEIKSICDKTGLHQVPLLFAGKTKKENIKIPEKSAYGDYCEGIVVKNNKHQVRGKYVKQDFVKAVNDSKFWRNKKIEINKVVNNEL